MKIRLFQLQRALRLVEEEMLPECPNAAVLENIAAIIEAVAIGFVPDPKPN